MRSLARLLTVLLALTLALPTQAAVTMTFWSHEFGNEFPHTFFTLYGTPDAGGAPVDATFGFTAKTVSPALLFGAVPGRIDVAKRSYMEHSDAQFAVTLTDAQYAAVLAFVKEWDPAQGGNGTYRLDGRNCVDFVKQAALRIGLVAPDLPKLMRKPRSYVLAVAEANPSVRVLHMEGTAYFAAQAAPPAPVAAAPLAAVPVAVAPVAAAPAVN